MSTWLAAGKSYLSPDVLWDALREVACSTKPHTDATVIVQLKRADVKKALDLIKQRFDAEI